MELSSTGIFKMFANAPKENRTCEKHGDYEASLLKTPAGEIWTVCPECETQRVHEENQQMIRDARKAQAQAKFDNMLNRAAIPKRFLNRTLDNYAVENENQARALKSSKRYAADWDAIRERGTSLIMCGNPGTGKTHLAIGIARHVMDQGQSAVFVRVIDMIRAVKETYNRDNPKTERQVIAEFAKPDLLILDEVGHQHGSETEKMIMFDVINARYEQCKPMILITNLTLVELRQLLDERTEDRLREGGGKVIQFDWQSYRAQA
ncbi:MAG: ATP-binding protein [Methyloprofundus sp.]|nr:ATP-binding protein [Methyloprofundus sp.]